VHKTHKLPQNNIKGAVEMKNSKGMNNTYTTSSTGAIDEGRNETTRLPYTDSISVPASEGTLKRHKKDRKK
jgi:hypothetical protein